MRMYSTQLTDLLSIQYPIIGGAMYPCSNPELVAAVSAAGGIGIVQPVSLTFVHGHDFREGLRYIRSLTDKPIGLNLLIEQSSKRYLKKNPQWFDIALEEGVRFFITALGKPDWVVKRCESVDGAVVFHDVTSLKWAKKAVAAGVDGLICVNNQAGGHAGERAPEALHESLQSLGLPLVLAGGVGGRASFEHALKIGYDGVQMGTRFIATEECQAHQDYKNAIVSSDEKDIVLTKTLTGVPVSVINTPYIKETGVEPGALARWCLGNPKLKHLMRTLYSVRSFFALRRSLKEGNDYREFFQAGKSVAAIDNVVSVQDVFDELVVSQREKTILCYGDSNTWGYRPDSVVSDTQIAGRFGTNQRWTGVLQQLLGSGYRVVEEGLNGRTTNIEYDDFRGKSGTYYLLPCLYSHAPLDCVILFLGINDLKTVFDISMEKMGLGLQELIQIVQSTLYGADSRSAPPVLVISPPPLQHEGFEDISGQRVFSGALEKSRRLEGCYRSVAESTGCYLLGLTNRVSFSEQDGLHFDEGGHRALAQVIFEKLLEIVAG